MPRRLPNLQIWMWFAALMIMPNILAMDCEMSMQMTNNGNENGNSNQNDNGAGNTLPGGTLPFGSISGTELLVEGSRVNEPSGDTRRRDERFTASYTLTPTSADSRQITINNEFSTAIFGDISGMAHLTYEESGTDFSPGLSCPTTSYSGDVEWDVEIVGTYDYIPALGTIQLTTHATNVSSTEYTVSYMTPGCPEQDSNNPSQYVWSGPGQGTWGFVDIVLENGHFEDRIENPQEDDRGAEDFYEIELNTNQ
ncbi:MAG: hypothetical protein H6819_04230 [Phycisphaerales bacterium]|nr:hypothetical protein [Phycisphaerales bacterium]MCB9856407.1 hypothetical protein [Phycisphaerales bacterium]MCB9864538.1 hypothetical protein [Phycisphaerales bacterium]